VVRAVTKVLVVETDPVVCDVIADTMEVEHAALVRTASTGTLGADALEREAFDLVIIDVFIPDMSGFALAERAANKNIPSLLCTGHPDALAQLRKYGCPHLAKPFTIADLVYESARTIANTTENIHRVKASIAKLRATTDGLQATIAESRRLLNESKVLSTGRPPVP